MTAARQARIAVLLRQGQVIAVQLSSVPDRDCQDDQAKISFSWGEQSGWLHKGCLVQCC